MLARHNRGHDAAEYAVSVLRKNHERLRAHVVAGTGEHGGGRLVARCLDAADSCHSRSTTERRGKLTTESTEGTENIARRMAVAPQLIQKLFCFRSSLPHFKTLGSLCSLWFIRPFPALCALRHPRARP